MEGDKQKKVEAGRERLAAYKKKKQKRKQPELSTSTSQSDTSLTSSPPLPENITNVSDAENLSDSSVISEHLNSNSDGIENDRSFQEIEISNALSNFSLLQNLSSNDNTEHISQENKPSPLNFSVLSSNSTSLNVIDKMNVDSQNNVQSILNEILRSEQFKSDSEHTLHQSGGIDSSDNSFNLFKDINLNDSLINEYNLKCVRPEEALEKSSLNFGNVSISSLGKPDDGLKVRQLEEIVNAKETTIAALTAELESLRELNSSTRSTPSLNTSTTDYKIYHDEFQYKLVEYQSALTHRDGIIQQLTEALKQSVLDREHLQEQSDYFSKEIVTLQKQLAETSALIRQRKWDISNVEAKFDSLKSIKDSSIQTDSLPSQILPHDSKNDDLPIDENDKSNLPIMVEAASPIRPGSTGDVEGSKSILNLDKECLILEETLTLPQLSLMQDVKDSINACVDLKIAEYCNVQQIELKNLEEKLQNEKTVYEAEISKLRELLNHIQCDPNDIVALRHELEAKHAKEMEELRTYFEQKCADLEKQKDANYSEEVFSQQSQKMSGSSSCSGSSEFLFSGSHPHSGPGGDSGLIHIDISRVEPTKHNFQEFTKNDCIKLKKDLSNINKDLNKYNLDDINQEEFTNLLLELQKYNLRNVFKFDLSAFKLEMQNKYHAELEILREDYENRIDTLNVEHNNQLQDIEKKYTEQIDSLKYDLDEALRNAEMNVSTAVQEVASSGEFELAEVVQSYERRLQEQVTLAKIDIINALEHQIQMLVANTADDAEWPTELLQIRNRFTERYEKHIEELNKHHQEEISKLKDEHFKIINGTVERARRKSLKDTTQLSETEVDIIQERDNLQKTTVLLRHLIGQLMKYFGECEDELNNTLVDELLKQGLGKNLTELEIELLNDETTQSNFGSLNSKKRVHFKPKVDEIISTIDNTDANISLDVRNELEACLDRLKADAIAILNLSVNYNKTENNTESDNEIRLASLTRQLVTESKIKKDLAMELDEAKKFVQNLEIERSNLETQVERLINKQNVLEKDLNDAKGKISDLIENGHKEIVSKGYGGLGTMEPHSLENRIAVLGELQDRARSMVVECASSEDHPLLELVDELCREGNRVTEEAKNEHQDLQQQIEAADKKLRATCRFLEEQAAEREQERDEAQKEIARLHEQIREREKDRVVCEQMSKEKEEVDSYADNLGCRTFKNIIVHNVEHLEAQIREMSKLIEESGTKQNEIETEKQEAIEKIFVLRDIIRDLESQVETKSESECELKAVIVQLRDIIKQQNKSNEELNQQLGSVRNIKEAQNYQNHIDQLEDEIQRLKLNTEFAGSEGAVKQLKIQLSEFESNIDERTRELEGLHFAVSTTNCSSPSEDMSIRDQIRPRTPSVLDECDLPLQQLARLKEKLIKHSRAEDAAVKRIHDLEMEIDGVKHDLDEVQNERDTLQGQVTEHLILISSLQMRLDDQRLRAEQVQKQTNTSLEVRIYDLENEIKSLIEIVAVRDKTIKHLNKTIDETKKKLHDQEIELTTKPDDKIIFELQEKINKLQSENALLQQKINNDAQNAQVLPGLVDNILADKNKDIERLQEKLDRTQSQLNEYLSLNLDHEQLKSLSRLSSSERAFSDILSLIDVNSHEKMRKVDRASESLSGSINIAPYKRIVNETASLPSEVRFEPEISSIEKLGKTNIHYSLEAPLPKPNSTEIHKSNERRVHFEDSVFNAAIEKLQEEILELKNEVFERDEMLKEYSERLNILADLEINVIKLQEKLEFTEKTLYETTSNFEKNLNTLTESEKNLKVELAEKKMHLMNKEEQLHLSEQDSARKDQMYINVVKEKRELEKMLNALQDENQQYKECDNVISENNREILNLKTQIAEMGSSANAIKKLETDLSVKQEELLRIQQEYESKMDELRVKLKDFENKMKQKDETNAKLQKDLINKESQLALLTQETVTLKETIQNKNKEIETIQNDVDHERKKIVAEFETNVKDLKNLVIDRETEIEILNEDTQRYQDDISNLETKLKSLKSSTNHAHELKINQNVRDIAARDLEIIKLTTQLDDMNRKLNHLQEILKEKDRVVEQMSDDSKSLRINLETIQNKMQESGNVVDLKRRLDEEKQLNISLREQLHTLKSESGYSKPVDMTVSIEEITGAVCEQLEYSAHLDSNILSALEIGDRGDTDDVQSLKHNISKERALCAELKNLNSGLEQNLQVLEGKYRCAEENVSKLVILLENEKRNCTTIQLEDANMLEKLRVRLEAALANENEFVKLLEMEKQTRLQLEQELMHLQQKLSAISSGENSKTEYKSLPTLETLELNRLRIEVHALGGEVTNLQAAIKDLKTEKLKCNATLKYTKDMLEFKNSEIQKLETRIGGLKEVEVAVKEKWMSCKSELEQKNRELENSRILIGELEEEQHQMKEQINKLNEKFAKAMEREKQLIEDIQAGQLKHTVPEKFLHKMKELNDMVHKHIKENEQMGKIIEKLNNERSTLQNRIAELEELNHVKFPFDDPVARANHLFARYLRSESYRKALAWQKQYMINLLATYQNYPLPLQGMGISPHNVKIQGKRRFRAVGVCIVAVTRMQFMVQRWHSGVRGVIRLRNRHHSQSSNLPYPASVFNTSPTFNAQFQVGQVVSSQNFPVQVVSPIYSHPFAIPSTSQHHDRSFTRSDTPTSPDLNPWSGQTPPCKEYPRRKQPS